MADGFAFAFPFCFPVDAFAGAGVKPDQAYWPWPIFVFPALGADAKRADGLGILEEMAQGACGTGGLGADDAARVCGAGEDVFVRLEGGEKAFGFLG